MRTLETVSDDMGEKSQEAGRHLREQMDAVSRATHEYRDRARVKAQEAARVTESYVSGHPWQALGYAIAVGAAVGILISALTSRSDSYSHRHSRRG